MHKTKARSNNVIIFTIIIDSKLNIMENIITIIDTQAFRHQIFYILYIIIFNL